MSQPSGTFNDSATGAMPFGSQLVSIGGVSYIANNITVKKPTIVLTGKTKTGFPTGETLIEDVMTGDMELQLADTSTTPPAVNAPFTLKDIGGAELKFKVSEPGAKFTSTGETVVPVTFRQRFGA